MKKIILAFDGTNFSEGAFKFARMLNNLQPILLVGVFLPQAQLANLWSYAHNAGTTFIPLLESNESELVQQNIDRFKDLCSSNDIEYHIHKDFYDFVLPELKRESRFADLLILSSETFYDSIRTDVPNSYLVDALHDAKCPVLLVPEKFDFPESVILAYDGSENSVFAIKQFAYLFPELTNRQALLVYANNHIEKDFPDKIPIEELVSRHFNNLTLYKLDIKPKNYFNSWVTKQRSALLVSGHMADPVYHSYLKKVL